MAKRKILYISSNHPKIRPGGLESYTLDLYDAFRQSEEFEPVLIARAGPPFTDPTSHHAGSWLTMVDTDPNQYLFYTNTFADHSSYDPLFGKWANKQVLTRFFTEFLLAQRPGIVHIQHTIFLGYDVIRVIRNILPDVPIVYSLHEYIPICHRDGQMVRTINEDLCQEESPRRCNECFPQISPQTFFKRKRFIQSHMSLVDCFVAPTEYVRDRYVEWGIPAETIEVEPQGMHPLAEVKREDTNLGPRNRFGFFGTLNPYKGADVLLRAMTILGDDFDGHLWIYGANLEIQEAGFRDRFDSLLKADISTVTFAGEYKREMLPNLMAGIDWVVVPSIWWETGPLVVWEAFQCGRPVICSDIGGMSEKVTDGVNGLHFRRRDPGQLADVMRRAAETPGLWDELRGGISEHPGRDMSHHVERLTTIYRRLIRSSPDIDPLDQLPVQRGVAGG